MYILSEIVQKKPKLAKIALLKENCYPKWFLLAMIINWERLGVVLMNGDLKFGYTNMYILSEIGPK